MSQEHAIDVTLYGTYSGAEIIAAAKKTADSRARFHSKKPYGESLPWIGQISEYGYEHVLVATSRDEFAILPEADYTQVVLMNYAWPVHVQVVGYSDERIFEELQQFAATLKRNLRR